MLRNRGFTLIELMVTVAIIGVLAATAIPAFMKYVKKSKTTEARQNVRKIYDGARQYYLDRNAANATDMQMLAPQFPRSHITPLDFVSDPQCCAGQAAPLREKCIPMASLWDDDPSWVAVHFSMPDPHYYAYRYESIAPFQDFYAAARGDLDCDSVDSFFYMHGFVNPNYADGPIGTGLIQRIDELE
jgi:type IV pilus assembly protein PilA